MKALDYLQVDDLDTLKKTKGAWTVTKEPRQNIIAATPYVVFSCNQCGVIRDLANYNISISGKINPAVFCMECTDICWVTLEGYNGQDYVRPPID